MYSIFSIYFSKSKEAPRITHCGQLLALEMRILLIKRNIILLVRQWLLYATQYRRKVHKDYNLVENFIVWFLVIFDAITRCAR